MSVMSSLRRQVFGVPPYKGKMGRAWMASERDSRTAVLKSAKATRKREAAKKASQRKRRERTK